MHPEQCWISKLLELINLHIFLLVTHNKCTQEFIALRRILVIPAEHPPIIKISYYLVSASSQFLLLQEVSVVCILHVKTFLNEVAKILANGLVIQAEYVLHLQVCSCLPKLLHIGWTDRQMAVQQLLSAHHHFLVFVFVLHY